MTAGRPTEYKPEMVEIARSYINTHYKENGEQIPTIAGLAFYLNTARSTIYDWASQEDKSDFSDILEALLAIQEKQLINKGLSGDFNPAITKMLLTKHGYSDKQELDLTSKGESVNFDAKHAAIAKEFEEKIKKEM